jgi:hypothetical protein
MVEQVTTWSRLQRLASDSDYTTAPFGTSTQSRLDYISVYAQIGTNS